MAAHDPGSLLGGLLGQTGGDAPAGSVLGALLLAAGQAQHGGAANPLCGLLDVLARSGPAVPSGLPPEPAAEPIARLSGRAASTRRAAAD
ncbi:hypothetical protein ACWEKM_23935 [Streptomyces sp. NPDC004752]